MLTESCSVLGDMLIHERDIRRKPPTNPEAILEALKKVRTFQSRIKAILDNLPRVFQFLDHEKDVYVPSSYSTQISEVIRRSD